MPASNPKIRLAVVTPFLDKRNGTERIVIEWLTHLPRDKFEIHIYSQGIEDIDPSVFVPHRIPKIGGPHLFNFVWWVVANHVRRFWDARFRGLRYDLVYSPGINCLDADVMSVHIVFAEYVRKNELQIRLSGHPVWAWPRLLHRRAYYKLIVFLERRLYTNSGVPLVLIARRTGGELERFYGRRNDMPVLYLGIDHAVFNPERRGVLREETRRMVSLPADCFALVLVGNDWRNKNVPVLLDALARLRELPVHLMVVSREDSAPLRSAIEAHALADRVHILPPRKDVEYYYAAADAYAGPSLEDTFALPPAEAMACGLPTIVSSENGTCEIIVHGENGLILDDPMDAAGLAAMIRRLYQEPDYRQRLGKSAAETALQLTWDRNGQELSAIFQKIVEGKAGKRANGNGHAMKRAGGKP